MEIDVRGLSCPEPLILLRNALKAQAACYTVLTDAEGTAQNLIQHAAAAGYAVQRGTADGAMVLTLTRSAE